jgi:hypothetical protein
MAVGAFKNFFCCTRVRRCLPTNLSTFEGNGAQLTAVLLQSRRTVVNKISCTPVGHLLLLPSYRFIVVEMILFERKVTSFPATKVFAPFSQIALLVALILKITAPRAVTEG